MTAPPRNLPRFLPTLTEVVHPADLVSVLSAPAPTLEAINSLAVAKQTEAALDISPAPETSTLINAVVAAQMQVLSDSLRQELEIMVKQAVQEAMKSKSASH